MSAPRTASTSDARKRITDAMNTIRDELADAMENLDTSKVDAFLAAGYAAFHGLTPPPAPSEPWSVIGTDRDKPTLARVTLAAGCEPSVLIAEFWRTRKNLKDVFGDRIVELSGVTHVELLHTHNPVTHVPVERALIDEAVQWLEGEEEGRTTAEIMADLASLASDESSASDGGRS